MRMEEGLDTGPVLLERRVAIGSGDTAGTLTERLAGEGSIAIVQALADLEVLDDKPQSEVGITYANKIDKSEAVIDWTATADEVSRRVRAFNPSPGAVTRVAGEPLKIWEVVVVEGSFGPAGMVVGQHHGAPLVACGEAGLALTLVQPAGSKRMPGTDFLRGRSIAPGTVLGKGRAD
jgi:methionyl-tRNA formyltransferase